MSRTFDTPLPIDELLDELDRTLASQTPPAKTLHRARKRANGADVSVLPGEASAALRDQLLAELNGLGLKDDLNAIGLD